MYESPLEKIYGNIQSQIIKQDEENIMFSVNQAVGYSVDKQELIKALNYDRDQYKKGYADAMSVIENIRAEIPFPEREKGEWINAKVGKLFPSNDYKCSICGNILNFDGVNCGRGDANFCPNCGAKMKGGEE